MRQCVCVRACVCVCVSGLGGGVPVEMECDFLIMFQHVASEVVASSVFGQEWRASIFGYTAHLHKP